MPRKAKAETKCSLPDALHFASANGRPVVICAEDWGKLMAALAIGVSSRTIFRPDWIDAIRASMRVRPVQRHQMVVALEMRKALFEMDAMEKGGKTASAEEIVNLFCDRPPDTRGNNKQAGNEEVDFSGLVEEETAAEAPKEEETADVGTC